MPIYEYKCLDCGSDFEKIVLSKSKLLNYQTCGSRRVEKRHSSFAVSMQTTVRNESTAGCFRCGAERPGACQQMD